MKPKIQRRSEDRQLNQARSKPKAQVNWPVRTARIFVHHYNSTQYCSTETVLLIFPSSRPMSDVANFIGRYCKNEHHITDLTIEQDT